MNLLTILFQLIHLYSAYLISSDTLQVLMFVIPTVSELRFMNVVILVFFRIVKETFVRIAEKFEIPWFAELIITASNDINEETILSLNEQVRKV